MGCWTFIAIAPLAAVLGSCSYVKDFLVDPTAMGEFTVHKNYEAVFKNVKAHALQCYQEKDYEHKTTIDAHLFSERKSAEVLVVRRGIDTAKYEMHVGIELLDPGETEVRVQDLYVQGAEHRLDGIKAAANTGSASC